MGGNKRLFFLFVMLSVYIGLKKTCYFDSRMFCVLAFFSYPTAERLQAYVKKSADTILLHILTLVVEGTMTSFFFLC